LDAWGKGEKGEKHGSSEVKTCPFEEEVWEQVKGGIVLRGKGGGRNSSAKGKKKITQPEIMWENRVASRGEGRGEKKK